jgi:hypothetical protein
LKGVPMKKALYTLYALVVFAAWILSIGGVLSAERSAPVRTTSLELRGGWACNLDRSDGRY